MLTLIAGAALAASPEPLAIVRRSLVLRERQSKQLACYSYQERVRKTDLDKSGQPVKVDVKTFSIIPLDGTPYRRLISRFDKPLSEAEAESERIKYARAEAERRSETPKQRASRRRQAEKDRDRNENVIREIPNAFEFRLLGEDEIGGRMCWLMEARPRKSYRPRSLRARILTGMEGKMWIDQVSGHWRRLEARLVNGVAFGWFLVRIHRGGWVVLENEPVEDALWAPRRLQYRVSMRLGLIQLLHYEVESRFSNYRRQPAAAP